MLKVLIADDEKPIRQWFEYVIKQYSSCYTIVGKAANGEEAYRMYQEYSPDIIITDILMPVINGIDLIKKITSANSRVKFLILSNYDNFQYVKEGLKLGAEDYLLKAETDDETIIRTLDKIKEKLKKEDEINSVKLVTEADLDNIKASVFRDILTNKVSSKQSNDTVSFLNFYAGQVIQRNMHIVALSVDNKPYASGNSVQETDISQKVLDVVNQSLNSVMGNGISYAMDINLYIVFFGLKPSSMPGGQYSKETKISELFIRVNEKLRNIPGVTVSFGVSSILDNLNFIKEKYQEAKSMLSLKFYTGPNSIHFFDKSYIYGTSRNGLNNDLRFLYKNFDVKEKNCLSCIEKMFSIISQSMSMSKTEVIDFFQKVLDRSEEILFDTTGISTESSKYNNCGDFEYLTDLHKYVIKQLTVINDTIFKHLYVYSDNVNKIIDYLNQNYTKKLNINELSKHVHLNNNYISQIFKKETGQNLNNYLASLRMEKARNLLVKKMRVKEISDILGYNNEGHFCTSFKKYFGVSPKEMLKHSEIDANRIEKEFKET